MATIPSRKPTPKKVAPPLSPLADPHEDWHQARVMALAAQFTREAPSLAMLFHVPNGGKRDKGTAHNLEMQGVKSGVPDLLLPVPLGGYTGLAIEMKRIKEGYPEDEQRVWMAALASAGWRVVLCRGWRAAWREIWRYVHLRSTREIRYYGGSPRLRKDTDENVQELPLLPEKRTRAGIR
jgi:hypothetical protein